MGRRSPAAGSVVLRSTDCATDPSLNVRSTAMSLKDLKAIWLPHWFKSRKDLGQAQVSQDKLEMVQGRAARYVFNDYSRFSHVTPMLQQLGWRSLMQRRADIWLVFFYKCLHGLVAIDLSKDLIPQRRETRGNHSQSYICPSDTRNYVSYSFLPRTIVQWNKLPETVVTSPSLDTHRETVCRLTH